MTEPKVQWKKKWPNLEKLIQAVRRLSAKTAKTVNGKFGYISYLPLSKWNFQLKIQPVLHKNKLHISQVF